MTIIKKITKKKRLYIISLYLIISSCNTQKNTTSQNSNKCVIMEMELNKFDLSSKNSQVANAEIENFFESSQKYDILNYSGKSGETNYTINRWYFKSEGVFVNIRIINEKKYSSEIHIKENEVKTLFEKIFSESYFKVCENCYGCRNGLLLIRSENIFFKYHYDGSLNIDSNGTDTNKIITAIDLFNFFYNQ